MACEKLDTCGFLDELIGSTPVASGMMMSTHCDNNFSYGSSKGTSVGDVSDYQWPNNRIESMELIMDRRGGIAITG